MEIFIGAYILIIGLIIGSFLNVCIYRIPRGESISFPPSHCTNCKTKIKPYDLIPVISYLFLRGKCRYCGEKISLKYPLIELATGLLFLGLYFSYGLSLTLAKFLCLAALLIVIGMIDLETTDVYFSISLTGIVIGAAFIVLGFFLKEASVKDSLFYLYGAFLGGGLIIVIILLTHGMGWGDAEICALCGLFLGLKLAVFMLFFSFIFGGIIGVALILSKKKSRKDPIPFGPFIALSTIFTMFFGDKIIIWYMKMLG